MIIINCEQGSELWYQARCGRVTSTRFKNLVSKDTTDSYRDLITNIACELITGKQEESYSNAMMEYGIETEPIAREKYEELFETKVQQIGFMIPDEDHRYHDWIGISPDGVLADSGLLEIKCPLARTHFEYIERNVLPSEYRYQVQGQLFVSGAPYCDFMSFVPGMKPFIIRVQPDQELFTEFEKRLDVLIVQVLEKINLYNKYSYDE
jgi:putative phage-type endonuclease